MDVQNERCSGLNGGYHDQSDTMPFSFELAVWPEALDAIKSIEFNFEAEAAATFQGTNTGKPHRNLSNPAISFLMSAGAGS